MFKGSGAVASGLLLPGCQARRPGMDGQKGYPVGVPSPTSGPSVAAGGRSVLTPEEAHLSAPVFLGVYAKAGDLNPQEAVEQVCKWLDWTWLKPGDSVFVKLACNSHMAHPAATSPHAVRAVVSELYKRRAGLVLVGDQSGVEYVRHVQGERRYRSTRELMKANGLYCAITESCAKPYFFDDQDYEGGYFPARLAGTGCSWRHPPYLAKVIQQVDHIIYLPRLSSHALAGYTHGHKIAVGWLRDDSRYELHRDGADFFKRYVELSYLPDVLSRLRLTITLAEQVLLDVGPDHGTIATPPFYTVIASSCLAHHDALSVGMLKYVDDRTPAKLTLFPPAYGPLANFSNRSFVAWFVASHTGLPWGSPRSGRYTRLPIHPYQKGIGSDLALGHAYSLFLGPGIVPRSITVETLGDSPRPCLLKCLECYGQGIFSIENTRFRAASRSSL